jgi:hypothetical protein
VRTDDARRRWAAYPYPTAAQRSCDKAVLGKLDQGVLVPQRDVRRAAHLTAAQMKAAIDFLTGQAPSAIRIEAEIVVVGNGAQLRRPVIGLAQ